MADVVEQALDQVRPQAAEKQVRSTVDLTDAALVLGDPRRLEQVVSNLVWNAIKFTEPRGHVNVRLSRGEREIVLSVTDTGVGISSAFLPYVFEWFRQADPRSRSQSGLGLGLGIVRHIVQLHGGGVRAESRGAGLGATFTVTLPVHEPAADADCKRRAEDDSRGHQRRHASTPRACWWSRTMRMSRDLVRVTLEEAGAYVETVSTCERRPARDGGGPARRPDLGHPHARRGRLLADPFAAARRAWPRPRSR